MQVFYSIMVDLFHVRLVGRLFITVIEFIGMKNFMQIYIILSNNTQFSLGLSGKNFDWLQLLPNRMWYIYLFTTLTLTVKDGDSIW